MNQKDFWKSKTFWVNIIAIAIFVIQMLWIKDFVIPVEIQGAILAVINFILRWVTKEEIIWDTRKLKTISYLERYQNMTNPELNKLCPMCEVILQFYRLKQHLIIQMTQAYEGNTELFEYMILSMFMQDQWFKHISDPFDIKVWTQTIEKLWYAKIQMFVAKQQK